MEKKEELIFVRLLIPYLLGLATISFIPSNNIVFLCTSPLYFISLLLITTSVICYKKWHVYRQPILFSAFLQLHFFFLALWIYQDQQEDLRPDHFSKHSFPFHQVWVSEEARFQERYVRLIVKVSRGMSDSSSMVLSGTLQLTIGPVDKTYLPPLYGEELLVFNRSTETVGPRQPGEFNYKQWLANRQILHQSFLPPEAVYATGKQRGSFIKKKALSIRRRQVERYRKLLKDDSAFAVASTLILGDRSDISTSLMEAYSKTGTLHALSVSGMHVGMIYAILHWVLSFLPNRLFFRLFQLLLIGVFIWAYALLTGFSPSVLRSVVMLSVLIVAKSFRRRTNGYNIWAFTALALLLFQPRLLWDVGFQLSFLAVFGLIYLYPRWKKQVYSPYRLLREAWSAIALSGAAQVVTFPLSIYYFHHFPLYFLFGNLFILLPVSFIMYMGILLLAFPFSSLAFLLESLLLFMNEGLKWISALPFSGISGIWITPFQLILLFTSLFLLLESFFRREKRMVFSGLAGLLLLEYSLCWSVVKASQQRKIFYYSLKNETAIAFIYGRNALLVTSLHPTSSTYLFSVKPALELAKVKETHWLPLHEDGQAGPFQKKGHQVLFFSHVLFIIDDCFPSLGFQPLAPHTFYWVRNHPKGDFFNDQRFKQMESSTFIFQKETPPHYDPLICEITKKNGVQVKILGKNKAYLVDLKEQNDK